MAASLDLSRFAVANATISEVNALPSATAQAPAFAELTSPSTEIEVRVASDCDIEIQIVDENGVRVNGARVHLSAGVQKLGFCGRDAQGRALPNGVYYYNVIVNDVVSTTRVTIAR
jgi:hypothetical protein